MVINQSLVDCFSGDPDFPNGLPLPIPGGKPAPLQQFPTGAVRSTDANSVRYDLISPIALRRLAETYKEGFDKYGAGNWVKGIPLSDLINHALRHIVLYLSGDRQEDHLAHAAWNIFTAIHFDETRPDLCNLVDYSVKSDKPNEEEKG